MSPATRSGFSFTFDGDPARHAALASCMALMIAAIAIGAWAVRAGNVVGFFSETVLVGFKAGLALYLAGTQLPKLFGFAGSHGDFWERAAYFFFSATWARQDAGACRRGDRAGVSRRRQAVAEE